MSLESTTLLDTAAIVCRYHNACAALAPFLDGRVPAVIAPSVVLGDVARALLPGVEPAAIERARAELAAERHDLEHLSVDTQGLLAELRAAGSLEAMGPGAYPGSMSNRGGHRAHQAPRSARPGPLRRAARGPLLDHPERVARRDHPARPD